RGWVFSSLTGRGKGVGLFSLIREDKLFSGIYVAGTAVAIASAMVIAIVFNMMLADIPPESNRSRTLYVYSRFILGEKADDIRYHKHSSVALDSCYRRMKCVEAATGIIPAMQNNYTIEGEEQMRQGQYEAPKASAIATDHDFFRIYDLDFIDGRPFSKKESDEGERVCVVTDKIVARTGSSTGGTVRVNDKPFRVVGVVKAVSAFLEEATADIYVPYTVEDLDLYPNGRSPLRNGDNYVEVTYDGNLQVQILLREGYTLKDFNAELEPLRQQYGAVISSQLGEKTEWTVEAWTHFFYKIHWFRPDGSDDQGLAQEAKSLMPPAILMLLFLFLPAINLSGLVSNRMEARRAEMGIRKAFGGKQRWLLREVINENLLLTLLGGIVGWLLSALFIAAISDNKVFLEMFVSRNQNVVDTGLQFQMFFTPTLFLIVFLCCVLLNLMAALLPAWHSLRKPIVESLNQKR
ncbi:MAG: ABC transporter permease, partial [Prevotella sp.]|nr:ABC transporter permease [Prevotella sp.]